MKYFFRALMSLMLVLPLISCGGRGPEKVGIAIATLLDSGLSTSRSHPSSGFLASLSQMVIKNAEACAFTEFHDPNDQAPSTCSILRAPPLGVQESPSIEPGTYGASSLAMTVTKEQDCETDFLNPLAYASFTIPTAKKFTCTDDAQFTIKAGSGIWTNDISTNISHFYGTFTIETDNQSTSEVKCTFSISDPKKDGGRVTGICEDSEGTATDQDDSVTCSAASS